MVTRSSYPKHQVLGKHTIKAGYSFSDVILTGTFVQRARGDYDYNNLEQYLLDQAPTGGNLSGVSGERSVGANNGVPFGFLSNAAFVNDDYRIRPNLTLNLGLRYEYVTMPVGSRAQEYSAIASVPGRHHLRQAAFFAQRLVAAHRLCLLAW